MWTNWLELNIRSPFIIISIPQQTQLYLHVVFMNHGLTKVLIANRDTQLFNLIWKELFSFFKIKLTMSTIYHTQIDEQTEKTNRSVKYMLWAFTLEEQGEWNIFFILVKFSYNNLVNS